MNLKNLNKLIAYVEQRRWHTDDWCDQRQCFRGMIVGARYGDLARKWAPLFPLAQLAIAKWLDIPEEEALDLFLMGDGRTSVWEHFEALDTDQQNTTLIGALRGLRDTGRVPF